MAQSTPEVSVCITTYNLEKFIGKALESILGQETSFNFEIIIHDDASTDKTVDVIRDYQERHPGIIKAVLQDTNLYRHHPGGLGHIFNSHLLPVTRGKYVAICDGDDYWTNSEKLEMQYRIMNKNPEFSGCFTNAEVINEMTGESAPYYENLPAGIFDRERALMKAGSTASASTIFFSKDRFTSSPFYGHYEDLSHYYEYDTLFVYCMILAGPAYYIDDITAIYRRWPQGLYSGILGDSAAISKLKESEMLGNQKLLKIAPASLHKTIKRKISVDSLYIIQNRSNFKRLKYLSNLRAREFIKWLMHK